MNDPFLHDSETIEHASRSGQSGRMYGGLEMRRQRFQQRILTIMLVATVMVSGSAQAKGIRDLLSRALEVHGVPAMAAAVITSDRILEIDAVGVQRLGWPSPVLITDRFHLGSLTKAMTSTLLAVLVEEGRIQWESRVLEVFPELAASAHPDFWHVTVEDLLSHRSGLTSFTDGAEFASLPEWQGSASERRLELTRYLLSRRATGSRGEYRYSNAGYAVAGAIAERVTGESWKSLMQTRLFEPLAMEAGFGWPGLLDPEQPWGHWWVGGVLTPHAPDAPYHLSDLIHPAGDVNAVLEDYIRFVQLHLRGLQERESFLSPATFRKLHQPVGSYALGWNIVDTEDGPVSQHLGSAGTFFTVVALAPQADLSIIVFTNAGHPQAQRAVEQVGTELLEIWIPIARDDR
jgi:CubicO group peptidase (beta-lactamase class C family)